MIDLEIDTKNPGLGLRKKARTPLLLENLGIATVSSMLCGSAKSVVEKGRGRERAPRGSRVENWIASPAALPFGSRVLGGDVEGEISSLIKARAATLKWTNQSNNQ